MGKVKKFQKIIKNRKFGFSEGYNFVVLRNLGVIAKTGELPTICFIH